MIQCFVKLHVCLGLLKAWSNYTSFKVYKITCKIRTVCSLSAGFSGPLRLVHKKQQLGVSGLEMLTEKKLNRAEQSKV